MKFLAIDTANEYMCVLAYKDGKVAKAFLPDCSMRHSTELMGQVEKALTECELTLDECDFFAAVVGAGSFTGIRIGVSAAKGFCLAKTSVSERRKRKSNRSLKRVIRSLLGISF